MSRYRTENSTSTPVFRDQFILGQLLFYSLDVCTWFINLVDCNNNFNSGCFRMIDRLYRLWHNTVISRNYKDCDICRICTTHTHCCEGFMSRCIKECDLLSVDGYHRSTNMLCDPACLSVCHTGRTDCIQKGCFTVVNVTHNTYNRWTCN